MTRRTVSRSIPVPRSSLRRVIEGPAFWAAIVLPFAYLPLLSGGLAAGQPRVFVALVAANVACLVVGHGHAR